ncbi:MAG: tRNA(Met) cytidine acetyltransferase TmcA [Bradymonadia bacterium]
MSVHLLQSLLAEASAHHHRRLLVLAGPRPWALSTLMGWLDATGVSDPLWVVPPAQKIDGMQRCTDPRQARQLLGQEARCVVVDLHDEADPDVLGVTFGLPRGAGLLIWLTPDLDGWAAQDDRQRERLSVTGWPAEAVGRRWIARLTRHIADTVTVVGPDGVISEGVTQGAPAARPLTPSDDLCLTDDQRKAVAAVKRAYTGRARRPVVLTADRGRGKSAALGIAAGELLAEKPLQICLTAPSRQAAGAVLRHARHVLGMKETTADITTPSGGRLWLMSPGDLLDLAPEADLLLVDEAATLPLPILSTLLTRYPRTAFSTTIHGYEGTGRGFTVKFPALLDSKARGWRAVRMQAPVRWAPDDPVEALAFRTLLLDAEPPPVPDEVPANLADETIFEVVDRDHLATDEDDLRDLFGLLITAHYRTGPADLLRMLDAPNMAVMGLRHASRWVSAALISLEGGLSEEMCAETLAGRRRPAGHMLPETLIYHSGLEAAGPLKAARVVRIATHPGLQGHDLGTRLLTELKVWGVHQGVDYLGSVFGVTPRLLGFWTRSGFHPVRLGVKRGKSSGAWSLVVVHWISGPGQKALQGEPRHFRHRLPHQLAGPLRALEPELAWRLLSALCAGSLTMDTPTERDLAEVRRCAESTQDPDLYRHACWLTVCWGISHADVSLTLTPDEWCCLLQYFVYNHDTAYVAGSFKLSGRGELMTWIRDILGRLIQTIDMLDQQETLRSLAEQRLTSDLELVHLSLDEHSWPERVTEVDRTPERLWQYIAALKTPHYSWADRRALMELVLDVGHPLVHTQVIEREVVVSRIKQTIKGAHPMMYLPVLSSYNYIPWVWDLN